MAEAGRILVGRFGAPHGVRGQVRLKSFTAEPEAIASYRTLKLVSGKPVRIASLRPQGAMLVATVDGVTSREAAETLNNLELFVDRAELPEPDEEEFYHADLIGLVAKGPDGAAIGTVTGVQDFGGGDIIAIRMPNGGELLVTFTRTNVPVVDVAGGFVVVVPPEETQVEGEGQ